MVVSALSRAGRIIIGLSHAELAERAGLPIVTIDQAGGIGSQVRSGPQPSGPSLRVKVCSSSKEVKDPWSDCAAQIPMTSPSGQTS